MAYPFSRIEDKWQQVWETQRTFATPPGATGPKIYILDMYPYPSGAGLHVGHPEGYTATDIFTRYRRMRGYHVLHPMGWDAFGLPAERYAMQTNIHPRVTTEQNIATFRRQIKMLGLSYDWAREVDTTDPRYYKWTQWIFLQIYNSWYDLRANKARPIRTLIEEFAAKGSAAVLGDGVLHGRRVAEQNLRRSSRRCSRAIGWRMSPRFPSTGARASVPCWQTKKWTSGWRKDTPLNAARCANG